MTSTLADLVDLTVGYAFKSRGFVDEPDAIRLLRGDNVSQGRLRWASAKHWPRAGMRGLDRYLVDEGDVVLAMDRPWIGGGLKQAVVRREDVPAALVQRVARLRARPGLDQDYLAAVVASHDFESHILSVITGSAVPHISGSQILAFRLERLPSEEEQRRIAAVIKALDEKIELTDVLTGAAWRSRSSLTETPASRRQAGFRLAPQGIGCLAEHPRQRRQHSGAGTSRGSPQRV